MWTFCGWNGQNIESSLQSGWPPGATKYRQLTCARWSRYVRSVQENGGVLPALACRCGGPRYVLQLIGSPGTAHFALHPDTMSRCAGSLQERTPSNMWSWSTKLRAYAQ